MLNNSLMMRAAERLVDFYTWVESMLDLTAPPSNPLTDEQILAHYQALIADPMLSQFAKQIMGPAAWAAFQQRMMEKASLLGMSDLGLATDVEPEDKTTMMLAAVEGLSQPGVSNGSE